ncbi:MAG: hypothetical protein WD066_14960 [Planctomycetaceae bacterium]
MSNPRDPIAASVFPKVGRSMFLSHNRSGASADMVSVWSYRVALWCGALPLTVGASIFLLWLLAGWTWLMVAGGCLLVAGPLVVLVGFAALGRGWWMERSAPPDTRRHSWRSSALVAALLLFNFPVAGGIVVAAIAIVSRYTIVVVNQSGKTLDDVVLEGGGRVVRFDPIPADASASRNVWFSHDDNELDFRAMSGTTPVTGTVLEYVTDSLGGRTITVDVDGTKGFRRAEFR